MVLPVLDAAVRSAARAAPRWGWGALGPTLAFVAVYGLALVWDGGAVFQARARPGQGAQIPWRAGIGTAVAVLLEGGVAAVWMSVWMRRLAGQPGPVAPGARAILLWSGGVALAFVLPLLPPAALVFVLPFGDLAGWLVAVALGLALLVSGTGAAYTVPWALDRALVPPRVLLAGEPRSQALENSRLWVRPRRAAVLGLHLAVLAWAILASDLASGWLPDGSLQQTGPVEASTSVLIREELQVSFFSHLGWHLGLLVAGAVWVELYRRQAEGETANRNVASK